jgi:hypothetical protein
MTWEEFKRQVEAVGVQPGTELAWIGIGPRTSAIDIYYGEDGQVRIFTSGTIDG